nr:hypothetical protein [Tanacetum cinerariifolium]
MLRILPVAASFALVLPLAVQAQQLAAPADSAKRLQEVTVYATRLGQLAGQTGRYVTVVPSSTLSRYPVTSLDDLLRFLPALEVQSRGSMGAQADITLRGSTFNQVLLLLDGMRLNDPLTGHFAGYLPIAPSEIEQIEIVRGPGAALYGPDAVGGFINIVTKTGQLRDAPSGGQRNDVKLNTYSLSGAYQLTEKFSAAARASFDRRDFNAQYFYTTNPTDQARETATRDWYQGQLRYDWNERA